MIEQFITVIAYIVFGPATLLFALHMYLSHNYHHSGNDGGDSLNKMVDAINGVKRIFHPGRWLIVAVVCWAWLITSWLS